MPDGRPYHPDHRLHGQVVPGKDALLHRACLHGETLRMIKMVVKVMMMVVVVTKMTKYTQHCPMFFQGVSVYISTFSMTAIALDRYSTNSFLNFATATMRSMPPNQWYFLFVCRALKSLRIFVELDSDSISTLFLRLGIHFPFPAFLISGKLNSWILTRAWHPFQFPMQQCENIKNFKTCIFVKLDSDSISPQFLWLQLYLTNFPISNPAMSTSKLFRKLPGVKSGLLS